MLFSYVIKDSIHFPYPSMLSVQISPLSYLRTHSNTISSGLREFYFSEVILATSNRLILQTRKIRAILRMCISCIGY